MSLPPLRTTRYLGRFSCLGPDCEDHCCAGWEGLDVDRATYDRYQQVRHPRLGPALRGLIAPNDGSNGASEFASIDLPPGECCPFFTTQRLCDIQLTLGEDLLPVHCDAFPRLAIRIDGQVELAARLSCPEIARLVLLAPDALEPVELEPDRRLTDRGRGWVEQLWLERPAPHEPRYHYHAIRGRCFELLARTTSPLSLRLMAIGQALAELSDRHFLEPPDLEQAFARAEPLLAGDAPRPRDEPDPLILRRLRAWVAMRGLPPRYQGVLSKIRLGLALPDDPSIPTGSATSAAFAAGQLAWQRFELGRPWLLTSYLVNHLWLSGFPYHPYRSFFETYALLVARFAMVKLHLVGVAGAAEQLDDGAVVETVQAFEKYADSPDYWDRLFGLLRREGALTTSALADLARH